MKTMLLSICIALVASVALAGDVVAPSGENQFLFVLPVASGSLQGSALTLNTTAPAIYFSDRPERIAGHMSLSDFARLWEGDFHTEPPNCVLSILSVDGAQTDVVLVLAGVQYADGVITGEAGILEGAMPKTFSQASLFVDMGATTSALPNDIRE